MELAQSILESLRKTLGPTYDLPDGGFGTSIVQFVGRDLARDTDIKVSVHAVPIDFMPRGAFELAGMQRVTLLHHRNILPVIEAGVSDGRMFWTNPSLTI